MICCQFLRICGVLGVRHWVYLMLIQAVQFAQSQTTIDCALNPSNDEASIRQTKNRTESSDLYTKYCHPFGIFPFCTRSHRVARHFKVYGPSMSKQKRNIVQVDSTLTETNLSSWWIQPKNENIPSASSRSERELFIKSVLGYNLHIKH